MDATAVVDEAAYRVARGVRGLLDELDAARGCLASAGDVAWVSEAAGAYRSVLDEAHAVVAHLSRGAAGVADAAGQHARSARQVVAVATAAAAAGGGAR